MLFSKKNELIFQNLCAHFSGKAFESLKLHQYSLDEAKFILSLHQNKPE